MSDPKSAPRTSNVGLIVVCVVGSLVLGGGGCFAGGVLTALSARKKAVTFCESVQVGEAVAPLVERARQGGLKTSATAALDSPQGTLLAYSVFMMQKHLCTVEHAHGKVVSKQLSSVD